MAVAAIHFPLGEQAGQIQLRVKSLDRLWYRQSGGPDTRIWFPSLGDRSPPPESASCRPHQLRKSSYGSTGSNTFTQSPPSLGTVLSGTPVRPANREKNNTQRPSGDHPAACGGAFVPGDTR